MTDLLSLPLDDVIKKRKTEQKLKERKKGPLQTKKPAAQRKGAKSQPKTTKAPVGKTGRVNSSSRGGTTTRKSAGNKIPISNGGVKKKGTKIRAAQQASVRQSGATKPQRTTNRGKRPVAPATKPNRGNRPVSQLPKPIKQQPQQLPRHPRVSPPQDLKFKVSIVNDLAVNAVERKRKRNETPADSADADEELSLDIVPPPSRPSASDVHSKQPAKRTQEEIRAPDASLDDEAQELELLKTLKKIKKRRLEAKLSKIGTSEPRQEPLVPSRVSTSRTQAVRVSTLSDRYTRLGVPLAPKPPSRV